MTIACRVCGILEDVGTDVICEDCADNIADPKAVRTRIMKLKGTLLWACGEIEGINLALYQEQGKALTITLSRKEAEFLWRLINDSHIPPLPEQQQKILEKFKRAGIWEQHQ